MGFSPLMRRISTTIIAMTSSIWMNPPTVYEVTTPNSHKITSIAAIVTSMMVIITSILSS